MENWSRNNMTKYYEYNGHTYEVPEGTTPEQFQEFLLGSAQNNLPAQNINPQEDNIYAQYPAASSFVSQAQHPTSGLDIGRSLGSGAINWFGKGGETIASLLTGGNAPKVNWEDIENITMPKERNHETELARSIGNFLPSAGISMLIPPLKLARFSPGLSKGAQTAVNYGGDILQNAGIMAGLNALEGESAKQGAIAGGGATAFINPLVQAFGSSNPIMRIGAAGILGGAAAHGAGSMIGQGNNYTDLAGALLGAGLAMKGRNAQELVKHDFNKYIQPGEGKRRLEASSRLGLDYITPAEATGNPLVAALEGRMGRTPEGARYLLAQSNNRLNSERKAIDNLLSTIETPSQKGQQQLLYQVSQTQQVPLKILQDLRNNSIFAQAEKNVKSDPIYKTELKGVTENSVKYLDTVKKHLSDMAEKETDPLTRKMTNRGRLINEQVKKITKELDDVSSEYKEARNLAELGKTREKLEKGIADETEIRGSDFYKKFLANRHKYKQLMYSLRNVPEAKRQVRDMKLAFKDLTNPTSVRTSKGMAEKSTSSKRVMSEVIKDYFHKMQGGHYDMEALKLITDPNWNKKLNQLPIGNDEKARMLANILSKATALPLSNI